MGSTNTAKKSALRKCCQCKAFKGISAFSKGKSTCHKCEKSVEDRLNNTRQLFLDYLRQNPCVDCGEKDPLVLEMDHIIFPKKMEVGDMVRSKYAWKTILKEISKCEVRCANCHRIKTAKDLNWWIYQQEYGQD